MLSKTCWPRARGLLALHRRLHRELVDVGAGDEGLLALAGQHDHAHARIVLARRDRGRQFRERLRVQCVEDFGAVEGDDGNGVDALKLQVFKGHSERHFTPRPDGNQAE